MELKSRGLSQRRACALASLSRTVLTYQVKAKDDSDMIEKLKELRARFSGMIAVDGGITKETAPAVVRAGVDILVAGTSVFGQKDRAQAIRDLRTAEVLT